ncbi:SMC-Scp complex subunit ScpB [Candidatus Uhrbacteria bacterium]|nr:SMC-Scp complex subunit ScpB [Candidatus Uhrbacteria bacterium]
MSLISQIESLLFVSHKPLSMKKISLNLAVSPKEVEECMRVLMEKYQDQEEHGILLVRNADQFQFVSSPRNVQIIQEYLKEDISGELTRPAVETLSIIAYRGPLSKSDIEQIRGINCSLILRNLLIRGLIDAKEDNVRMEKMYNISFDFLRHLGLQSASQLPEYERLSALDIMQDAV